MGSFYDDFRKRLFAADHMPDIVSRMNAEDNIDIGQTQIGIQNQHPMTQACQRHSEISHDIGFSHPAFSAGDGNDPGGAA